MRRSTALPLLLGLFLLGATVACRDDTVRLTFRPKVGAVYRYEVKVHSRSEVRLQGERPQVRDDDITLQSEQTVLAAGRDGVRVKVVLGDASGSVRTFVVRFDRAAQLQSVESDATSIPQGGDAGTAAGTFGISEIFPAAAGAPPERRLGPGERWRIDDRVAVPGAVEPAQLTGSGRLVELGIEGGAKVARLATSSTLRLGSAQDTAAGERVLLDGRQVTRQRSTHDLSDGALRTATATTVGTFDLEITPPLGQPREPVQGTLSVRVTSRTQRL
ncbi:MAG: hypothetical protein QOI47_2401 [Actinomycetota bacterium]|nr:hypothetical protein [Actinomycetota bacterium]